MNIVLFINKKNGFAKALIGYLEKNFPLHDMHFYIIDRRFEENLPDQKNVHRIQSYREFLTNKELRNNMFGCDKIIVSGVFTMHIVLPFFTKKIIEKTYLQFWGGDFYCFRYEGLKTNIMKHFMDYCVKYCAGVVTLVKEERDEFFRYFPYTKKYFAVPIPNGPKEDCLYAKYRQKALNHPIVLERIVVGNSSTDENQHLEVFDLLKEMHLNGVEIWCPLSYGDMEYQTQVIAKGRELFGEAFHPITEYMPYEKYLDFLSSCSVGIYNCNRQQGMGNISMLVNMGKKVYMRSDTAMWDHYKSFGYRIYDVADLSSQTKEELFRWTTQEQDENFQAIERRNEEFLAVWNEIINE